MSLTTVRSTLAIPSLIATPLGIFIPCKSYEKMFSSRGDSIIEEVDKVNKKNKYKKQWK